MDYVNNNIKKIDPSVVCKATLKGDILAKEILTEVVNYLSIGIINLIFGNVPRLRD